MLLRPVCLFPGVALTRDLRADNTPESVEIPAVVSRVTPGRDHAIELLTPELITPDETNITHSRLWYNDASCIARCACVCHGRRP